MNDLATILQKEYGIIAEAVLPAPGGFSTKAAYRVVSRDGREYFLKAYDKTLPTTRFFVERIDRYMPVLDELSAHPLLRGSVLTPIPTRNKAYKTESADEVYALFNFVHGDVPGIQGMTRSQTVALAEILAALHSAGSTIPIEASGLSEDTSLTFCEQLSHFLANAIQGHAALAKIIAPNVALLQAAIEDTLLVRDTERLNDPPIVLCHGDAHGDNVIQGERLVLADWEDLRFAPAEADLFIHAWHPHGQALLEAYSSARKGYRIDEKLLYFYTMRRRIEDIWVDVQRLTEESPDKEETAQLLDYVHQGIDEVQKLHAKRPT